MMPEGGRKKLWNILKYIIFLAIGIFIFWWIYKDFKLEDIKAIFKELNYGWLILTIFLGFLSQLSRAIRWNMLIRPLGYKPKLKNTFLAVVVLYFVNLLIPRAGEIARCTVLTKYEKIPLSKLIGTVIVERLADFITMIILGIIIFSINVSSLQKFLFLHPEINNKLIKLLSLTNVLFGIAVLFFILLIFIIAKPWKHSKMGEKVKKIKHNFTDGIKSIMKLENKWYFIGHTLLIFTLWLLMLYAVFLAFPPTRHLSIWTGMFTFLMGSFAMLAPVQGGIGPWHFMIYETLSIFGISLADGKIFALIAHTSTNLINLVFGFLALLLLPLVNQKKKKDHGRL
ncbi:MAG: lysylphosphatidylglycerol synthase transmembrane domain-containing protein [Bacteroidota bacterium]|nr:lysylphosphatidylglycerol synthase transmembrane domain-containing protein [Bacteroidota bacterium]MDP4273602.1 lysylphosphatidylglycerol synthase transmembrane domain-containing protein [Bacteroidota bacterium]